MAIGAWLSAKVMFRSVAVGGLGLSGEGGSGLEIFKRLVVDLILAVRGI
jgi:hypothetical protein